MKPTISESNEYYARRAEREETVEEMLARLLIPDEELNEMMHEADEIFAHGGR